MNERETSEAVVDWIGETLGIPAAARYPYPVGVKTGPLKHDQPDVAAIVERKRTLLAAEALQVFPWMAELQQVVLVRAFDVAASVMLQVEQNEASAKEVFQRLQGYGATLEASALDSDTLGERVPMISPAMAFDYSAVFGETEDGTRGRMVVCEFTIGEPVEDFG